MIVSIFISIDIYVWVQIVDIHRYMYVNLQTYRVEIYASFPIESHKFVCIANSFVSRAAMTNNIIDLSTRTNHNSIRRWTHWHWYDYDVKPCTLVSSTDKTIIPLLIDWKRYSLLCFLSHARTFNCIFINQVRIPGISRRFSTTDNHARRLYSWISYNIYYRAYYI